MRIVVDANIIIGGLLGSRGKLAIITSQNHKIYAPEIIIKEIIKYKDKISEKMEWSDEEFDFYFDALLIFIKSIEKEEYIKYLEKAKNAIIRDVKDSDYIACALHLKADFIWTEDKDFSEQSLVKVKTTNEFIDQRKF
jgi:predicted nucleic acid-binding protein